MCNVPLCFSWQSSKTWPYLLLMLVNQAKQMMRWFSACQTYGFPVGGMWNIWYADRIFTSWGMEHTPARVICWSLSEMMVISPVHSASTTLCTLPSEACWSMALAGWRGDFIASISWMSAPQTRPRKSSLHAASYTTLQSSTKMSQRKNSMMTMMGETWWARMR